MNSESHRKLLIKVLNEAHVACDITLDKFEGIVNNIMVNNRLTFMEEEIPAKGREHNHALHISIKFMDYILARILIDNSEEYILVSCPKPSGNIEATKKALETIAYVETKSKREKSTNAMAMATIIIMEKGYKLGQELGKNYGGKADEEEADLEPPTDLKRMVELEDKVDTAMMKDTKGKMIRLLVEYVDIFSWTYQDMPGLDSIIVEHKLPVYLECYPVKQKLQRMKPKVSLKIMEEVEKQLEAGFLAMTKYPQWVAKIIPVPKKDGKVRMCVDYQDLNWASLKDDFSLQHIDVPVDNTTRHYKIYKI
ncbi:hypothetical protein CR513_27243, partial [Mucuna pruriens]